MFSKTSGVIANAHIKKSWFDCNMFFRKGIGTAEPVNLWVYTVLNNAISPNFVVWEFYGSAQLPKSFVLFARNSAESVCFHKISMPEN